ncbi:hypothetical protein INR49_012083 [Caranx melampygus]|nr:hypothetical protein INR49_012083 [Caranx melampygus]
MDRRKLAGGGGDALLRGGQTSLTHTGLCSSFRSHPEGQSALDPSTVSGVICGLKLFHKSSAVRIGASCRNPPVEDKVKVASRWKRKQHHGNCSNEPTFSSILSSFSR